MFVLIQHFGDAEEHEVDYKVVGAYQTVEEAHHVMSCEVEKQASEWQACKSLCVEVDDDSAYVMDGDMWDHQLWFTWRIVDTDDKPRVYSL